MKAIRVLLMIFVSMMLDFGFSEIVEAEIIYCVTPQMPVYSSVANGEIVKIGMRVSGSMVDIEGKKTDNSAFLQSGTMEIWDGKDSQGGRKLISRTYSAGTTTVNDRLDLKFLNHGMHYLYGRFVTSENVIYWTDKIIASIVEAAKADFSASPREGIEPLEISFQSLSTGSVQEYLWRFGDGGTSTKANPRYVYQKSGSYSVELQVTGPNKCGFDKEVKDNYIQVKTKEVPKLEVDFEGVPRQGEVGFTVNFTSYVTGNTPITAYSWDFGDGQGSPAAHPSHVYGKPGTFSVSLTVYGDNVKAANMKSNYIVVNQPEEKFEVDFSGSPLTGTVPLTVYFQSSSSGVSSVDSYTWEFGDNYTTYVQNPVHTYLLPGVYTVSLVASSGSKRAEKVKYNYVFVDKKGDDPIPPCAFFVAEPVKGVSPLKVSFSATCDQNAIHSYLWDFGDGGSATTRAPEYVYKQAGVYSVSLSVKGAGGDDVLLKENLIRVSNPEFSLQFPLKFKTPWTAVINSVFDHSMERAYSADYRVVAYTGEEAWLPDGEDPDSSIYADYVNTFQNDALFGFRHPQNNRFQINGHYSGDRFLYYDGHPGYDFRTTDQHPEGRVSAYAMFSGTVNAVGGNFGLVKVDHDNGYETLFLHCSEFFVEVGDFVNVGDLLATTGDKGVSGAPHLHVEVRYKGLAVDPYGWLGKYQDPHFMPNNMLWHTAGGAFNPPKDVDFLAGEVLDNEIKIYWGYDTEVEDMAGFFLYRDNGAGFIYSETLDAERREYRTTEVDNGKKVGFKLTAFNQTNQESSGKVIYLTETDDQNDEEDEEDSGEEPVSSDDEDGADDIEEQPVDEETTICGKTDQGNVSVCALSSSGGFRSLVWLFSTSLVFIFMSRFGRT